MAERTPLMRLVRAGVVALVGAELVYVMAANLLLSGALGRGPLEGPKVDVTWDLAWTVIPGRVHVRGLNLDVHPSTTRVVVQVAEVDAALDVMALFSKTVSVPHVEVQGASVDIAQLGKKDPPATPKPASGWALDIGQAALTLDTLQVLDKKVTGGEATLSAGLHVDFGGEVEAKSVVLDWSGASVEDGDTTLVEAVVVKFDGGLAMNPKVDKGDALLADIAGTLALQGQARTLAPLKQLLGKATWLEALDGAGSVDVKLTLANGELAEGGTVDVEADRLSLSALGFDASGNGSVKGAVKADSLQVDVAFTDLEAKRDGAVVVKGKGLALTATMAGRALVPTTPHVVADLALADLSVPDVDLFGAFLPASDQLKLTGGSGTINGKAHADTASSDVTAELEVRFVDVAGQYAHLGFTSDVDVTVRVVGGDLSKRELDVKRTAVAFRNTRFTEKGAPWPWSMRAVVSEGRVVLGSPVGLDVKAELHLENIRPILAFFGQEKPVVDHLQKLLTAKDVTASARIALVDGGLGVHGLELSSSSLTSKAELRVGKAEFDGLFWAKLGILGFAVERTPDGTKVHPIGARKWFDKELPAFEKAYPFIGLP
ncbi:MAG: hypothetical protein ACI8PZ_007176 [Myxococcota bacterium]